MIGKKYDQTLIFKNCHRNSLIGNDSKMNDRKNKILMTFRLSVLGSEKIYRLLKHSERHARLKPITD